MDSRLSILVVHNRYQQAGGERVAVEALLALLRQKGHRVTSYERDNADIDTYGLPDKAVFIPNTIFSLRTYREVRELAARFKPDVAHIHNVFPLISPSVYTALADADIPIVQTLHNFRLLCPNALFYTHGHTCERCMRGNTLHAIPRRCYRESYALSALYAGVIGMHRLRRTWSLIDRYIALTQFTAQKLVESGLASPARVTVLGNFLPDPLPESGSLVQRDSYVVYVGRLSPEKGVDTLVRAMADVPQIHLKILGDGPDMCRLQALARRERLERVEFLGHVVGARKWDLMRHALATVVPSTWYEHLPFAILESFAVGTPVVASNLGSLPHIVEDDKSGLLFHTNDPEDLAQKLGWLAHHPKEASAMGHQGHQLIKARYSSGAHYEKLMAIYSEVTQ